MNEQSKHAQPTLTEVAAIGDILQSRFMARFYDGTVLVEAKNAEMMLMHFMHSFDGTLIFSEFYENEHEDTSKLMKTLLACRTITIERDVFDMAGDLIKTLTFESLTLKPKDVNIILDCSGPMRFQATFRG